MTPRTITVALLAAIALSLGGSRPGDGERAIESFVTTMTDPQGGGPYTQAGGHPDLETNFSLANPGNPEAAKNIASMHRRACSATSTRSPSAPRRTLPSISARPTPSSA